jgi:hypothetical protein
MGLLLNKNSFGTGIDGGPSSPAKMLIETPAEMSPKQQAEFSLQNPFVMNHQDTNSKVSKSLNLESTSKRRKLISKTPGN